MLRLAALLSWLFSTAWQLRKLDGKDKMFREQLLKRLSGDCLKAVNLRIELQNPLPENHSDKGLLVVSNHVSWLDAPVVMALCPSGFIAMQELQSWPVIGKMVAGVGTVFIDRSNRKAVDPINEAIVAKLAEGSNVCFFPEARTSLGNGVLPLKAALFQSALDGGADIQILALRYYVDGKRTEEVSFADIGLLKSLWRVVSLSEIVVKVDCAPILKRASWPADTDRFAVKEKVEVYLNEKVLSDSPNPQRLLP